MKNHIYTIGHSTHQIAYFLELLKTHQIDVIVDVRSVPYSRFNPQFSKAPFSSSLRANNIKYVFMGDEFGARCPDESCYIDGRVQYDLLANTKAFKSGINRIKLGLGHNYKMALMCAEKDPLECHRTVLVARNLEKEGFEVVHILADGATETHNETTARLLRQRKSEQGNDLFLTHNQIVEQAYKVLEEKIAFTEETESYQKKVM
ncbi:MAG: DUF488 family protein [Candidatus Halichondribacter symbioticus]